ncbi:dual serine/threonine and tyrosine protein kinase-like isoform X2 [Lineus longissimus]
MALKHKKAHLHREMSEEMVEGIDLDNLRQCLETFKQNRNVLEECYDKTNRQFEDLRKVLSINDDAATKILFMSDDDKKSVKQILNKNPVILVVGQTNCGKTSLINEILQRSYLPTSEFPCTARLVRTRYSEEGYIKIKNEKGDTLKEVEIDGKLKRVPRQYIVLEGEARELKETVEQTVEVGIDDPLLRCGVEIIDAPGTCENEALDNIVQECLDGVLQVVLYVIDGNTSLRRPDVAFLYRLKRMAPNMRIIYVCNKVEEDERANKFDQPSDCESDDEDALNPDVGVPEYTRDKGQLAFFRLQKTGIIDQEETMKTCAHFHPISCSQLRIARRKHKATMHGDRNPYLANFRKLLACLMEYFQVCVNKHLLQATKRLLTVQKRTFDFFIADKFLNVPRIEQLPAVIKKILKEELEHYNEMKQHIDTQQMEMFNIITKYLHDSVERTQIIHDAGEIAFAPIKIGDEVHRNYVINECRKQVRDFVLMKVTKDIERKIRNVKDAISRKFGESFQLNVMQLQDIGPISDILQEQLDGNYMLTFDSGSPVDIAIDTGVVKEGIGQRALNAFENVKANMRGIYLDGAWKEDTAKAVLRSVDATKLAASICSRIHLQVNKGHENFTIAMRQINCLYSVRQRQTKSEQQKLLEQVPEFASNICLTEALQSSIASGPLKLEGRFGEGSRAVVYGCSYQTESSSSRKNIAAKVFKREQIPTDFATVYNYLRLLPKANHFLRPHGVGFTCGNKFTVLLPKIDTNLFAELAKDSPMRDRLSIYDRVSLAVDIASACSHAANNGFRLTDLRPNNITLLHLKGHHSGRPLIKMHVIKWKEEDLPYPDGRPPFHFAPEAYCKGKASPKLKNPNKKYDAYSMAIITWLLVIGKFIRPRFAMQDNETVKNYVQNNTEEVAQELLQTIFELDDPSVKENRKCMQLIQDILERFIVGADNRGGIHNLHGTLKDFIDKTQFEFEERLV